MATIKDENWDGVTAPAIPAGWTAEANIETTTLAADSSPNSLRVTALNAAKNLYYATLDGNGGDAQLTARIRLAASANQVVCGVLVRITSAPANTCYYAFLSWTPGAGAEVGLQKRVSGTPTVLASNINFSTGFNATYWYILTLTCNGTTISVQLQRPSDGYYLTAGATWQSTPTTCFSVTDSAISGQGYAGLRLFRNQSGDAGYADRALYQSLASGTIQYGAAEVLGAALLTGTGRRKAFGQGMCQGAALLSVSAWRKLFGGAALQGVALVTSDGRRRRFGGAALQGAGLLTPTGRKQLSGTAAMQGAGTLSAAAWRRLVGSVLAQGVGLLTADGLVVGPGAHAELIGVATLTADGRVLRVGQATLQGAALLSVAGHTLLTGQAVLQGVALLTAAGEIVGAVPYIKLPTTAALTNDGLLEAILTNNGLLTVELS